MSLNSDGTCAGRISRGSHIEHLWTKTLTVSHWCGAISLPICDLKTLKFVLLICGYSVLYSEALLIPRQRSHFVDRLSGELVGLTQHYLHRPTKLTAFVSAWFWLSFCFYLFICTITNLPQIPLFSAHTNLPLLVIVPVSHTLNPSSIHSFLCRIICPLLPYLFFTYWQTDLPTLCVPV
jgi:hypothetical protein